jgi:HSP20 family protein
VSSDSVTIKAKTSRDEESAEGDYHRREISRGYFSRTVTLPGTVDADKGKASFEDGLLRVTLPKSEVAKRQAIEID